MCEWPDFLRFRGGLPTEIDSGENCFLSPCSALRVVWGYREDDGAVLVPISPEPVENSCSMLPLELNETLAFLRKLVPEAVLDVWMIWFIEMPPILP